MVLKPEKVCRGAGPEAGGLQGARAERGGKVVGVRGSDSGLARMPEERAEVWKEPVMCDGLPCHRGGEVGARGWVSPVDSLPAHVSG